MRTSHQIILLGEVPLIAELSTVCHALGYTPVTISSPQQSLPEYCIQTKKRPKSALAAFELTNTDFLTKKENLLALEKSLSPETMIFSSAITTTITEQARWLKHPERLIGISALPTLLQKKLIEISISRFVTESILNSAREFLASLGKETSLIQDRIGMVFPRILCMLINEAYFALMEEVAQPNDIDLAMKLGTNYPNGPIQWSQQIGLRQVVSTLDAIHTDTGEERYRVAPLLRSLSRNT